MSKPLVVWINCYGAWDPEHRPKLENDGYGEYLDGVVDLLLAHKDTVSAVHISGGMYDSQGKTECETTIPELEKRLAAKGVSGWAFMADERSVTSISIVRTFLQAWKNEYPGHDALLVIDEVRYPTNAYALEYLAEKMEMQIPPSDQVLVSIPRPDTHPHSTPEFQAKKLEEMKEKGVEEVEREGMEARKEHLTRKS
ncbi:MAG: hypothetical protein WCO52_01765 [bacterium]